MKSSIKAMAVLGSASVVNILTGLVSAKVSALLLGPGGLGLSGLMFSLLGLVGMLATMGVNAGLVRDGARALAEGDPAQVASVRGAAWLLCAVLGGIAAVAMILTRVPISRFMLGGTEHSNDVIIIAVALLLTQATSIQLGTLNAYQCVGALVRTTIMGSVLNVAISLLIIWQWRISGIPWVVLATSVVPWVISFHFLRRLHPGERAGSSRHDTLAAAAKLLKFGVPYTASLLVGAGLVSFMPVIVLHALGENAAGYYRASSAIAVSYLGFLTAAMAQDYYPRVSAITNDNAALIRVVNEQHRLLLLLVGPIILAMLALVPYLVPLLYSSKFVPAVEVLEWQLLSDFFRLAAWTMAFVVLAHGGSTVFFLLELGGGAGMALFSWLGMRWLGLTGLGVAFLGSSIFYYILCLMLLRRSTGFRWSGQNIRLLAVLVALGAIVRALPQLGLEQARTPVALVLAVLMGAYSFHTLGREIGGYREVLGFVRRRGRMAPVPPEAV